LLFAWNPTHPAPNIPRQKSASHISFGGTLEINFSSK
jgi:hypothetical protein